MGNATGIPASMYLMLGNFYYPNFFLYSSLYDKWTMWLFFELIFFNKIIILIMINCSYPFLSEADKSYVEAGAEICINYGNKGNEVLLTKIMCRSSVISLWQMFCSSFRFPFYYTCNDLGSLSLSHIFLFRLTCSNILIRHHDTYLIVSCRTMEPLQEISLDLYS